jgi:hypothetical protein
MFMFFLWGQSKFESISNLLISNGEWTDSLFFVLFVDMERDIMKNEKSVKHIHDASSQLPVATCKNGEKIIRASLPYQQTDVRA